MFAEALYAGSPAWAQTLMLNAYALRIERHRYGSPYRAAVRDLLEQQHWSPDKLRTWQDDRLRSVVRVAYERSPFYQRRMLERGIAPSDIRGIDDLSRLPLLTKAELRAHGHELLTRLSPARGWLHGHTSGTTGSPLSLWYDRQTCVMTNAVDSRQKLWAGRRDSDWIGLFLGRVIVPPGRSRPPFWRANLVHRQVWFSSFHMNAGNLDLYVQEIRRRKLRFLEGYPSTLFILAQHVLQRGVELPMHAVFTSSETLHEIQRDAIERAFHCRLFDFYGHAERTLFAAECEAHDGKHLAEEYGYAEVVDADGEPVPAGVAGYLVGTSLHNEAMPLIRYVTGDITAIERGPCSCGRTLARIQNVSTKAEDIVVTPDGRMISPSVLTHPFKPFDQITKSQVIQETVNRVLVKVVPSAEFNLEHERLLLDGLRSRLGSGMEVIVERVEEIPAEPSGKYRWVISRVPHAARFSWGEHDGPAHH